MNRARLPHYVLAGLLAWGLPAAIVVGPAALAWVAAAAAPLWLAIRRQPEPVTGAGEGLDPPLVPLSVGALAYLLLDASLGRRKLEQNMFLFGGALERVLEQINEGVSQGRGVAELLGAILAFLPFALADVARRSRGRPAALAWTAAAALAFYDAAISRGYALVAVLALLAGGRASWRRLALAGAAALTVFTAASFLRGDFQEVAFANPLIDAMGWPYLNLALLRESDCGHASFLEYGVEFAKKFLPAFLLPKTIFTFNVEMTRCIYPMFGDEVASVSVFTWVGELVYYAPPVATALLAGSLLTVLAVAGERLLERAELPSTRAFAGLMTIVLLRSRTQDVSSFLIFLILFLAGWTAWASRDAARWLGGHAGGGSEDSVTE